MVPAATAATPDPATAPISLHILPVTNRGVRFTAKADGVYRFTVEKGAIRNCPDKNTCNTWFSQLMIYKNREVQFGTENSSPVSSDYLLGIGYTSSDFAAVEKINKGRYIDVPLKKDDYLIFISYDCIQCYGDNVGGVYLSVSIIGALP